MAFWYLLRSKFLRKTYDVWKWWVHLINDYVYDINIFEFTWLTSSVFLAVRWCCCCCGWCWVASSINNSEMVLCSFINWLLYLSWPHRRNVHTIYLSISAVKWATSSWIVVENVIIIIVLVLSARSAVCIDFFFLSVWWKLNAPLCGLHTFYHYYSMLNDFDHTLVNSDSLVEQFP